ncbi:HEAT repeat domain-containing protein [Dyadobacter sp. UP-52]|uniref:HEAT repeat domain-containing protein n=2 Tax=Dyadobacter subterraneus TaxID=2773304 RepID=A0ABR9W5D6_9BACT|nr:HEAT repeat domain-containing protein [Dyadobacter subterraneus]
MTLDTNLTTLLSHLTKTEHGFKHIISAGDDLIKDENLNHFEIAQELIKHESYQGRMLGTYLFGALCAENISALKILKTQVSKDENWRVQEMLAKAFDYYAKQIGYKSALPEIENWLSDENPNVVRAVIEGLRIWTSRPCFKENPEIAIQLISQHNQNESEYVRKSVGNALRDISRKFPDLVKRKTAEWNLEDKRIAFTSKLILKK